ncbi:histidinol dehydrogenase [Aliidiomarina haloalkalitolerans]|uniref:Histidinol dehydrogenase n=1 Tax=Aliidiomarina haloalkalitolerans TaxID=859059 RepID=A0A432VXB4_9GAMM|nr:histidinol dehydrogenase [Aliidiomarina haloalkalitolerans]MCL4409966.1 histidinol dehydrogenase [Gammaproteobacteria bacterium]RUO21341.1 histidinol dehydrogenase [Aliidiomarina haloalkalitolerans]
MATDIQVINWQDASAAERSAALARPVQAVSARLQAQVRDIIDRVASQGDQALLDYTAQFDGVRLASPVLPMATVAALAEQASPAVQRAIDQAYNNIRQFHLAQQPQNVQVETMPGIVCEQRFQPLERVGLYIPGGSASLPSTVLMLGIPAQIANCQERILISPPSAGGQLSPAICYAAIKCGITQVCLGGGAQAIAALALGTESITKVDKIFGPGNSYVTEAKQQVSQIAGGPAIDMPAGPSEILVIADDSAEPAFVAADLLSQAEHGPDSQVILLSPSRTLIEQVKVELSEQLAALPRQSIAQQALSASALILTRDLTEAVAISQAYAPEHLLLQFDDTDSYLPKLTNAGSIFVGHYTPESGGDYATGTNHVLPTYGFARNYSSLGLLDFYRRYTVQTVSAQGLQDLGQTLIDLAAEEQLDAHLRAVSLRLESPRMQADLAAEQLSQESRS